MDPSSLDVINVVHEWQRKLKMNYGYYKTIDANMIKVIADFQNHPFTDIFYWKPNRTFEFEILLFQTEVALINDAVVAFVNAFNDNATFLRHIYPVNLDCEEVNFWNDGEAIIENLNKVRCVELLQVAQ